MTTTLHPDATWTTGTDVLRALLGDALEVVVDDDAERYSSRTTAGRTLLSLAALARRAAGALGGEAGAPLAGGPGVVVQRELAAAVRRLDEAARTARRDPAELGDLLLPAQRLHAQLLGTVAAGRR